MQGNYFKLFNKIRQTSKGETVRSREIGDHNRYRQLLNWIRRLKLVSIIAKARDCNCCRYRQPLN